jgi:hypothetical protein
VPRVTSNRIETRIRPSRPDKHCDIRVEHRKAYMAALENASVLHDISDFARFIVAEMTDSADLKGLKK